MHGTNKAKQNVRNRNWKLAKAHRYTALSCLLFYVSYLLAQFGKKTEKEKKQNKTRRIRDS